MRYKILLTTCAVFSILSLTAQKTQNRAFAITGSMKGSMEWMNVQLIDLNTGEVLRSVFDNKQSAFTAYNARSGQSIQVKDARGMVTDQTGGVVSPHDVTTWATSARSTRIGHKCDTTRYL